MKRCLILMLLLGLLLTDVYKRQVRLTGNVRADGEDQGQGRIIAAIALLCAAAHVRRAEESRIDIVQTGLEMCIRDRTGAEQLQSIHAASSTASRRSFFLRIRVALLSGTEAWERDGKARALADCGTDCDRAEIPPDHLMHDGKAESRAAGLTAAGLVDAVEAVEDGLQRVFES